MCKDKKNIWIFYEGKVLNFCEKTQKYMFFHWPIIYHYNDFSSPVPFWSYLQLIFQLS